jgi:repressor LexA
MEVGEQMVKKSMSPLQHTIYEFIDQYIQEHSYSPTLEEIARGIGISSRSVSLISRSVHALVGAGQLVFYKKGYRNIRVAKRAEWSLPLLGRIAAGSPIEAIPNRQTLDVGALIQHDKHFVLEVKGDSMVDEGILDGDYIICHPTEGAVEGDIVIALVDQADVTLKRISYKIKNKITLVPANVNLQPQSYLPERIQIQGVFVGLLRLKK